MYNCTPFYICLYYTPQGSVIIGKNSRVEKLNPTKDHPYLFRVTDGKTGTPYDLSAHDPQIMCNWMEILQTVCVCTCAIDCSSISMVCENSSV